MSADNIGNKLNQIVNVAKNSLFAQGELAQLTYGALDIAATKVNESDDETIEITYPVGYRPNKTAIQSTYKYTKDELLQRYQFLAYYQLSVNGLVQLVTIIETMLSDVIRALVLKYPQKLNAKRTIKLQTVLESSTIEEVHLRATDSFLNELAYKSPSDFAESVTTLLSINLLECPVYHCYMEIKASRDIFIHNRGIVNEVYIKKAGSHQRAKQGTELPADVTYFLESYENCLQLTEWLEKQLHEHWHSIDLENRNNKQVEMDLPENDNNDSKSNV